MKLCPTSQFPFVRLGDCGEVVAGSTPPRDNTEYWGGEIPFVTPAQLDLQQPVSSGEEYVTSEGAARGHLLSEGTVLVCCDEPLGKTGIVGVPLIVNPQISAIIFDPKQVYMRYGYYAARSLAPLLDFYASTTTIKRVQRSTFSDLQIPLPPLSEQKRIAAILDKVDALRARRRESLVQLDALTQSTFFEMFGNPVTNSMGSEMVLIGDLLTSARRGTSKKADAANDMYPILRGDNIKYSGGWDFESLEYIDLDEEEVGQYLVCRGQLLFNCRARHKEHVGNTAVYREDQPMAFNRDLIRGVVNENADPEYIGAFMNTPQIKQFLQHKCKTTSLGTARIDAKGFQAIPISNPPLSLQHRFAGIVEIGEQHKAAQRTHLYELDKLFVSLSQRAFKGEL